MCPVVPSYNQQQEVSASHRQVVSPFGGLQKNLLILSWLYGNLKSWCPPAQRAGKAMPQ